MEELTPKEIVQELDRYIIGQDDAKRAVAISLRDRWRRQHVDDELRDEIMPKNIIMVGPTGVGKTEVARRLSNIAMSPFIKVEASKFTEVGYVGRDVESMIRDLTELAVNDVRAEMMDDLTEKAEESAENQILEILFPPPFEPAKAVGLDVLSDMEDAASQEEMDRDVKTLPFPGMGGDVSDAESPDTARSGGQAVREAAEPIDPEALKRWERTKEKMRTRLRAGDFDDTEIDIRVRDAVGAVGLNILSSPGLEEMGVDIRSIISALPFPTEKRSRREKVSRAREILAQQELQTMLDMDSVVKEAVERVEDTGIVFLDEIDKIVGRETYSGPDVSREGVQRDILPIVEGTTVLTKYGMVRTDHILFIAAGAFHNCKVSDLIPELQGRFPITVSLSPLGKKEFERILVEPQNALIRQYKALLKAEQINLDFTDDAIKEIAKIAETINANHEDIGARRLHTVVDKLLNDLSFEAPELHDSEVVVDAAYVRDKVENLAEARDLSQFIL